MQYRVGVMIMDVEQKHSERFRARAVAATRAFETTLSQSLDLSVDLLTFDGPHLTPARGGYRPLDFLQIGTTEKLERGVHFLLIITEVDLTATTFSYTLALPSQLTNVGILSAKRLDPKFWGKGGTGKEETLERLVVERLRTLLLHTFGHLLNLPHASESSNVMYDIAGVDDLDAMASLNDDQRNRLLRALPREAHERTSSGSRWSFFARMLLRNWRSIGRATLRANPFRLMTRLPTMITAALSVIIVVFFSAEVWDVGSTVEFYQLAIFSLIAVGTATTVLYRSFAFSGVLTRGRVLAESTVVTSAATALSVFLTMLLLFLIFMSLTYVSAISIFPRKLMETWPTVDPAVRVLDHVKLGMFIAAMGVLAGSLGGRADSKDLVRTVLFVDEET